MSKLIRAALGSLAALAVPSMAFAQDATLNSGDTAWILTATALVLFMSLPGLALFYGGLVRAIVGAFVERVKFLPVMIFTALWLLVVYAPVTHWIWSDSGWLYQAGLVDFAGGLVVHATAGISALVYVFMLGKRKGFPNELAVPHRPAIVMIGASMLWVGWFGFNGGSALAADGAAAARFI